MSTIGDSATFFEENSEKLMELVVTELKNVENSNSGSINGAVCKFLLEIKEMIERKDYIGLALRRETNFLTYYEHRLMKEALDRILPACSDE